MLKVLTLILSAMCSGCFLMKSENSDTQPARVTVEMEVFSPDLLCKNGEVVLSRLVLEMVSNQKDTVIDVITREGSLLSLDEDTFLATTLSTQIISARYNLEPGKSWKITAKLYDGLDSVRQLDTLKVPRLASFERRTVAMCLHPRLSALSAHFYLPAQILVDEPGTDGVLRRIFFSRITLTEGGQTKRDTTADLRFGFGFVGADPAVLPGSENSVFFPSGSMGETPSIHLDDDYVPVGKRSFTLNAYGYLEGDTVGVRTPRLLFKGTQSVDTELAKEAGAVAMQWQAEDVSLNTTTSSGSPLVVKLGAVGTLIMNVRMSGALDL